MPAWYQRNVIETAAELETDLTAGLTQSAVAARLEKNGPNELQKQPGPSVWQKILAQLKDFLILLLLGAAVISLFLGETSDAVVIFLVVILNTALGVVQELKAEKALSALEELTAPLAKVHRDGQTREVAAKELVPGDLILLEAGDFVPADARLVTAESLQVNEAALTGESVPVTKDAEFTAAEDLPLGDQKNMVFKGTIVTFGRGRALVTGTGMNTELGRIAGLLQSGPEEKTPLQKRLDSFGKQVGLLAVGICLFIFLVGLLRGNRFYEMFLVAVSLAVAAIPEGLPAIITIVLALGVQRMAGQKAIIRRLPAVETLGSATVICSDKTGTLTQNAMTVRRIVTMTADYEVTGEGLKAEGEFRRDGTAVAVEEQPLLDLMLKIGALCNDAEFLPEEAKIVGDPTEGALVVAAAKAGLSRHKLQTAYPRQREYPFDSVRKRMSTVHQGNLAPRWLGEGEDRRWLLVKGAPDLVLEQCQWWLGEDGPQELTAERKAELLKVNHQLATEALRVLAFAFRPDPPSGSVPVEEAEKDLIFVGFMGMIDPPRPEAKEALRVCQEAGIAVKMITGDHRDTAVAIAQQLGLAGPGDPVLVGAELETLDGEELAKQVARVSVFARVAPEHKVRIVDALKQNGAIVAMTGDGVNDAPALKKADIGAAMGQTGTDVAKEAADMVLADDNFATIVRAVQEGRVIFENIKKTVYFLLSCNLGEIITIFTAILLGWPVPLYPIQILWVNLVTDSLPALALGVDPPEGDIMKKPPIYPEQGIFDRKSRRLLILFGLFIAGVTLTAFRIGLRETVPKAETMAFATLGLCQLVHAYNFRSLTASLWRRGPFQNKQLLWASVGSTFMHLIVFFTPWLRGIFRTELLPLSDWLVVFGLAVTPLLLGEFLKLVTKERSSTV
ncbi:MAG TPA: calcium-translocating P-type ATPase, SERCA-type [Firmicutes bacterium]|nr:calcium-translocating P-type ATPase, SERCA-type [Bacillota bacterium]